MSDTTMRVDISQEIRIPKVPNFLMLVGTKGGSMSIGDLTDEQLECVAARWTMSLLIRAAEIRANRKEIE